ncbi:MAG TPA: alkaline phosphatase family protein [Acidimicrobiia bacterium]|nr:alkaline phosphatase family protein [Acidimicrobiia bacterium]
MERTATGEHRLPAHQLADAHRADAEAALEVLLDGALEPIVDMVCTSRDGCYEALAHDGSVMFRRALDGGGYERVEVSGRDPLRDQSTNKFTPLADELDHPFPGRSDNSYPHAFDQIAQLFDAPAAPDLCVLHTAAHNWEDQGGHLGEHGSLGLVQARAPFVLAGKGVRNLGLVPDSARLVDVAPTLCALLGCAPRGVTRAGAARYLAVQDGDARVDLLDPVDRPAHVVGFLFDGTNANVLYDMAARGEAPNVARLIEMGLALGHGAIASLPTVTLANHTTIITGAHPGHHGILHNAWYDRGAAKQIITNSSATWPWSMQHMVPGVETIHHAVHRTWPEAFTASVNEPCDPGADYSTFGFFRRGEVPPIPEDPVGLPHTTERFVRPSKDYSWSSVVDHMGVDQTLGIIGGHYRDTAYPQPRFLWCNFTLTDAAMHEGGPYSEIAAASVRDCDGRIGAILAALEQAGVFDDCAFALVADHGMEQNDPACRGDWDEALRSRGIKARDEAYGFLYFGVPVA